MIFGKLLRMLKSDIEGLLSMDADSGQNFGPPLRSYTAWTVTFFMKIHASRMTSMAVIELPVMHGEN